MGRSCALLIGALVLGSAVASGCAPGLDQDDAAAADRAAAALAEVDRVSDAVGRAEFVLVQRCMEDAGFRVHPPTPVAIPDSATQADLSPTVETAKAEGYGIASRRTALSESTSDDGAEAAWQAQGEQYHMRYDAASGGRVEDRVSYVFDGGITSIPGGGCNGTQRQALYGSLEQFLRLSWIAQEANRIDDSDIASDSRWRDAVAMWAGCMSSRGFDDVAEPNDALTAAIEVYADVDPGLGAERAAQAEEIRIAVADAECAEQAGTSRVYTEVRAELNSQYLADHEADLVAWRDMTDAANQRARELLGR